MDLQSSLLLTDLYQLSMVNAYYEKGMLGMAVFEFQVRGLPSNRNFLLAAGQEQVIRFLQNARFTEEELEWLAGSGRYSNRVVEHLAGWRFSGEVHGLPEGTLCFPNEPILRVTAPLPEAQLVESRIINLLQLSTLVASKAARCVLVAPGKQLVDFGLRRAHGAEAGLLAARASYLAGFAGTATVLAAPLYGIPIFGTMAHSFVEAHDSETEAFENFAHAQPENVTLLIDTYDTERGAMKVVELAPRLRDAGIRIRGVRVDSGDLGAHAQKVRQILDRGGLREVRIFASGDLDEYRIRDLLATGAPIDGFGVGTKLVTSADTPYLDCAYKLMEYDHRPRRKLSEGKVTWPGRKQVFRVFDGRGRMVRDLVTLEHVRAPGEPLMECLMRNGERTSPERDSREIRAYVAEQLDRLPDALRQLEKHDYPVEISDEIRQLCSQIDRQLKASAVID